MKNPILSSPNNATGAAFTSPGTRCGINYQSDNQTHHLCVRVSLEFRLCQEKERSEGDSSSPPLGLVCSFHSRRRLGLWFHCSKYYSDVHSGRIALLQDTLGFPGIWHSIAASSCSHGLSLPLFSLPCLPTLEHSARLYHSKQEDQPHAHHEVGVVPGSTKGNWLDLYM